MAQRVCCLLLIIVAFASCKKDKVVPEPDNQPEPCTTYDTLFPGKYLPAYPGSYWTYYDSIKQKTFTYTTSDNYELAESSSPLYKCTYVPVYNGDQLFKYTITMDEWCPDGGRWGYSYLSEDLQKNEAIEMHPCPKGCYPHFVLHHDTSIYVNNILYDSVIVMIDGGSCYDTIAPQYGYKRRYYAPNVGMIKMDCIDCASNGDTSTYAFLIDYHINK